MTTPAKKRGRPRKKVETEEPKRNAMGRIIPPDPVYTLTLTMGKETYTSTGKSILEAVQNFQPPEKITVKGVLVLTEGNRSTERDFAPVQIKRFFYPIARFWSAKYLETTLK